MPSGAADPTDLVRRLNSVVEAIHGVPDRDLQSVGELIQVGEYEVALENLCTQVYEYGVAVDGHSLEMIRQLAAELGVPDRYWTVLDSR